MKTRIYQNGENSIVFELVFSQESKEKKRAQKPNEITFTRWHIERQMEKETTTQPVLVQLIRSMNRNYYYVEKKKERTLFLSLSSLNNLPFLLLLASDAMVLFINHMLHF